MDSIQVQGGIALQGKTKIQGSKNGALPILAASLLLPEPVTLKNCPKISDVYDMICILESLGCLVRWEKEGLRIDPGKATDAGLPREAVAGMRSSILLLGALLGRFGRARLDYPGGCVIGKRPIDLHIEALQAMGVDFDRESDQLSAHTSCLRGTELRLRFPSVGATENILLCAAAARGTTRIIGAAREPEVQALCEFLNTCGCDIRGMGSSILTIEGGRPLRGGEFTVPGDRIVAGTYLLAGFACGGNIFLEGAPVHHMEAVLDTAERMGAVLTVSENGIYAQCPRGGGRLPHLHTDVYPGFPTDLQSVLLAVRCSAMGSTLIRENIFEDRFRVVQPLRQMGGILQIEGSNTVRVTGVEHLHGCCVQGEELRGGAALVVAGLGARGVTVIRGKRYIDRGYENICRDMLELGARIASVSEG